MNKLSRKEFVVIVGGVLSSIPRGVQAQESEIVLDTATGRIYGTLTMPASVKRNTSIPIALIIAGSGPTDRNGNSPGLVMSIYLLLAQALATAGIASVRYDKRGVGASAAALTSEADIRFENYIDDAAAWITLLYNDRRFTHVNVAGHSEGSLIGMIAARTASAATFISLEGAGHPAAHILHFQLQNLPEPLKARADTITNQLQAGHTVSDVPVELLPLFRPSVQPYLISWLKYDPAAEIAKLRIPVTIVQGTADVQITMTEEAVLAAAAPRAHIVIVEGMNHVLKHAPDISSKDAIIAGYTNLGLPLEPKAVDAVIMGVQSGGEKAS